MTVIVIPAHDVPDTYTENEVALDVQLIEQGIPQQAARGPAAPLGRYLELMLITAGRYLARDDAKRARRMLEVGADCAGALFAASGHEGPVTFALEGKPLTSAGGPLHALAEVSTWLDALTLALALRRTDVVSTVLAYSDDKLREVPGTRVGEAYRLPLAAGLRAFLQGRSYERLLAEAERLSRPEHLQLASPHHVRRLRALIPLVRAIAAKDQPAFTSACVEAVHGHRDYYAQGKERAYPAGLLAHQAAGLAAVGVDRGLTYEVESAYTPRWLVLGRAP